jgi:hypothetical protein
MKATQKRLEAVSKLGMGRLEVGMLWCLWGLVGEAVILETWALRHIWMKGSGKKQVLFRVCVSLWL